MRARHWSWAAVVLAVVAPAQAEPPEATVVWYRASEGCPEGPDFVSLLGEWASRARLAEAGDRVDYVVTLSTSDDGSTGRLERQTDRGTIAVSELHDASCRQVAEALALSLALSLESGGHDEAAAEVPESSGRAPASSAPAPAQTPAPSNASQPQASSQPQAPAAPQPPPRVADQPDATTSPEPAVDFWVVGVQGGAMSGAAPGALPWLEVFLESDGALRQTLPDLAVRAGAVGALGSTRTIVGRVRQWIVAGRVDLCPVRFGTMRVGLWPCAALDLGAVGVSGTGSTAVRDVGLWAAAGAHGRIRWWFAGPVAVEAQLGVHAPLTRYEVRGADEVLYRTEIAGFSGAVGPSIRLP